MSNRPAPRVKARQAAPASRQPESASFTRRAAVVFVAAIALRLAHLWFVRQSPFFDVLFGDAQSYDASARRIAGGDWIGQGVFYQAPLYPYFLAALYSLGGGLFWVRMCQAIVGAASVLLGYAAAELFDRRVGLVAGLLLAFYGPAVFFDALIQKSVLDLFLICLAILIVSRAIVRQPSGYRWLGLGLTLGALVLTRENVLVLTLPLLAWIVLRPVEQVRSRVRHAALLPLGVLIVLAPVVMRNRVVGGEFVLTTAQTGPNFFIGNNPKANGTYVPLRPGRGSFEFEQADANDLAVRSSGRALSAGEVSAYWTGRALRVHRRASIRLAQARVAEVRPALECVRGDGRRRVRKRMPITPRRCGWRLAS